MTPGQMAVAALGDGEKGVVLVVLDLDGSPITVTGLSEREARQEIDRSVERLDAEMLDGSQTAAMRRIQGGHWACRMRCPDGKVRLFVDKRASRSAPTRRPLSINRRWDVLMRDGFRCRYCGRCAPDVTLEIDHVIPVADGGTDDLSNLVAACADCNAGKGRKRLPSEHRDPDRVPASREAT